MKYMKHVTGFKVILDKDAFLPWELELDYRYSLMSSTDSTIEGTLFKHFKDLMTLFSYVLGFPENQEGG